LRSGEYLGRWRNCAPAASITSLTPATMWALRVRLRMRFGD
jgi:hypothetical protein